MQKVVLFLALVAVATIGVFSERSSQPEQNSLYSNRIFLSFAQKCKKAFKGEKIAMMFYAFKCIFYKDLAKKICIAKKARVFAEGPPPTVDMTALRERLSRALSSIWIWDKDVKSFSQIGIDGCPDVQNFELEKFYDCVKETCANSGTIPDISVKITWINVSPGDVRFNVDIENIENLFGASASINYTVTSDMGFESRGYVGDAVAVNNIQDTSLSRVDFCNESAEYTVDVKVTINGVRELLAVSSATAEVIDRDSFFAPQLFYFGIQRSSTNDMVNADGWFEYCNLRSMESINLTVAGQHYRGQDGPFSALNTPCPSGDIICKDRSSIAEWKITQIMNEGPPGEFILIEDCSDVTQTCELTAVTHPRYIYSHATSSTFGGNEGYPLGVDRTFRISDSKGGKVILTVSEMELFRKPSKEVKCYEDEAYLQIDDNDILCGKLTEVTYESEVNTPMVVKFFTGQATNSSKGFSINYITKFGAVTSFF